MRSAEKIIRAARYRTGNESFTYDVATGVTSAGLAQSVFVELINDAQEHLQSRIIKVWPSLFTEFVEIPTVFQQESYDIPVELAFNSKVLSVQYSVTGQPDYYRPLDKMSVMQRNGGYGYPCGYIRTGAKLFLNPIPDTSTGKLRVAYYRRLDKLDISRGTVNGTPSGATITVDDLHEFEIDDNRYLCISGSDGQVLLRNGIVSSTTSTVITLAADVSTYLESGVVLADLAGATITVGKNSTTVSKLPEECERFLKVYVQHRIMNVNESSSSAVEDKELAKIVTDITANMADEDGDITPIYVHDYDSYY